MTDEMTGGTFVPASKENSIYNRRVRVSDQILKGLIYLAAASAFSTVCGPGSASRARGSNPATTPPRRSTRDSSTQ